MHSYIQDPDQETKTPGILEASMSLPVSTPKVELCWQYQRLVLPVLISASMKSCNVHNTLVLVLQP